MKANNNAPSGKVAHCKCSCVNCVNYYCGRCEKHTSDELMSLIREDTQGLIDKELLHE